MNYLILNINFIYELNVKGQSEITRKNNKILEITQNIETAENNCGKLLDESDKTFDNIEKIIMSYIS